MLGEGIKLTSFYCRFSQASAFREIHCWRDWRMKVFQRFFSVFPALALVVLSGALTAIPTKTHAQQFPYFDTADPNVDVDLTVIGGQGGGSRPGALFGAPSRGYMPPAGARRGLLVPGSRNPVSQIHIPGAGGRIKLKRPSSGFVSAPKRPSVAPPPKAIPPKPVIAASPPSPVTIKPTPQAAEKTAPKKKSPTLFGLAKEPPPPPASITEKEPPPHASLKLTAPTAAKPKKPRVAAAPAPRKAKQQASLPAGKSSLSKGRALRVTFNKSSTNLPETAKTNLKALAAKLNKQGDFRLQLLAYAGGGALSPSKARRLSLSRALSIRSFLIEAGVRSTRIDVRALGDKTSEKPLNRVDLNITKR